MRRVRIVEKDLDRRLDFIEIPDPRQGFQQDAAKVVKEHTKVDDVLAQFTFWCDDDRFDRTTDALAPFSLRLRGFDGLPVRCNDPATEFWMNGACVIPIGDEDSAVDDRHGWRIAADAKPLDLVELITP